MNDSQIIYMVVGIFWIIFSAPWFLTAKMLHDAWSRKLSVACILMGIGCIALGCLWIIIALKDVTA